VSDETTTMSRSVGGEVTYTENVPALPKVVTVSVLIPEDYYAKALERHKASQGTGAGASKSGGTTTIEKIKEETDKAVKELVASAIPAPDPSNPNAKNNITVNSFVPVKEVIPEFKPSTLDTVTSIASQWGSAVGLAVFAIWALWMLRGTMPKAAPPSTPPAMTASVTVSPTGGGGGGGGSTAAKGEAEKVVEPYVEDPIQTLNDRDQVQNMVRNNPEVAVAIIGKWLQNAR
jgi:flagellar M-ring protein FliF